jgi:nucleotide-binding universal stress UspA family protein
MYDRILVPIDGSQTSKHGLREAIALAKALKSELVLLHVVDDYALLMGGVTPDALDDALRRLRSRGDEWLTDAASAAAAQGVACKTRLNDDRETIADSILKEARSNDCSLIVMGTHGRRGMKRLAMGSDAELVIRSSAVPVLLVRAPDSH